MINTGPGAARSSEKRRPGAACCAACSRLLPSVPSDRSALPSFPRTRENHEPRTAFPIRTEVYAMVAPPDNDVLWARGLQFRHADGSPGLSGVSLGVREGEILAVGGPRGSGKTTRLRCLAGLIPVHGGEVWFNSGPLHTLGPVARERLRRERFGWIDPEPVLVPELN